MIKVLVSGLKEPVGGLEKVVFEYVKPLIKKYDIHFDFIIFNKNFSKEQELSRLGTIFHVTSRKDNLKKYKEELEDIFRKTSYDAVWGNYTGLTNIDLLVLAKKHNVPVRIAHSHVSALSWGSHVMEYVVKLLHYYNKKRLPKFATHYWGCSESACSFMFPSKEKNNFTVIKNAVDINIFHPDKNKRNTVREELGIFSSAPIIGHVARMCKEKNQFFLLSVFAEIIKLCPDAILLFIGDGELKDQLIEQAHLLKIENSIIFTGYKSNVADYLCAMDVFVLPSISEGLGLCAIEAQASGVPCVVSDVVPSVVDISETTEFLSLNSEKTLWAETILFSCKKNINEPAECVSKNGYEINVQAEKIIKIFTGDKV